MIVQRTRQPTHLEVGLTQPGSEEKRRLLEALGTHILCELSGCDPNILTDVEGIEEILKAAALKANATVLTTAFHRFEPHGVSGVVVIAESHLSIHTWPETGYAAMDFYTCGSHTSPGAACEYAAEMLRARSMRTTEVKRGIEARKNEFTHIVTTDHEERRLTRKKRTA